MNDQNTMYMMEFNGELIHNTLVAFFYL